jgi:hypothetical protein
MNLVYANKGAGISFHYISSRNTIKENIVFSNGNGIRCSLLWEGFGEQRIYHNDIFHNKEQIFGSSGSVDFQYWDNGYPSGGNYWSDYKGQDTNSDGIGDSPHRLIGKAKDNFPLMKHWNRVQAAVDMDPDWLSFDTKEDWITVYVELPAGLPVEDIEISTLLLNESISPEKKKVFISDYDNDGIPDMTVKFRRQAVYQLLQSDENVELTVSGRLKNGLPFEASHTLKALDN